MPVIYTEPFASMPALWENSSTQYTTPRDPNYPYVYGAQRAHIEAVLGPSGENVLRLNDELGFIAFSDYGPWDATCGLMTVDMKLRSGVVTPSAWYDVSILKGSLNVAGQGNIRFQLKQNSLSGSTINASWRCSYNSSGIFTPVVTADVEVGEWNRYIVNWQCGSGVDTGGPGINFVTPTPNPDGYIRVTKQPLGGSLLTLMNVTGLDLYVNPGSSWGGSFSGINYNNHAELTNSSVMDWTNFILQSCGASGRAPMLVVK